MERITISRDDDLYEAFADIAQTPDGILVVTYRESLRHGPQPFLAGGGAPQPRRGAYLGTERTVVERTEEQQQAGEGMLNCSRLLCAADGTLYLAVDLLYKPEVEPEPGMILLFRSSDGGATWEGPQETGITWGIVPSIKQLTDGDLLLGVTRIHFPTGKRSDMREQQLVYRSRDLGATWEGPAAVPDPATPSANGLPWRLNEGDFAELDDGTVVCYMREDAETLSGWKSLSSDGGRSWSVPIRAQMNACLGRPSVGRLRSGEIAITYRYGAGRLAQPGAARGTPAEAARTGPVDRDRWGGGFPPGAYRVPGQRPRGVSRQRLQRLGATRQRRPLRGQLRDRRSPRAQIRGYLVSRSDWYLYPEGDIWWYHPRTTAPTSRGRGPNPRPSIGARGSVAAGVYPPRSNRSERNETMQEASPTPIERFERDGYLVVRNALPDPVLQPIRDLITATSTPTRASCRPREPSNRFTPTPPSSGGLRCSTATRSRACAPGTRSCSRPSFMRWCGTRRSSMRCSRCWARRSPSTAITTCAPSSPAALTPPSRCTRTASTTARRRATSW